jgi:radical SAM-linked protein
MSLSSPAAAPIRQRVRARFAKQGELRFIGHQDLARTIERLLRRAGVQLSMTEGFHPRARLSFPLALAVGIAAEEEIVEMDLAEEVDVARLAEQIQAQAPPGLSFHDVELLPPGTRKAAVESITFMLPLPFDRRAAAAACVAEFLEAATWPIWRPKRKAPLDLRGDVLELAIEDGSLRMRLAVSHEGMPRPREILEALKLADLEQQGLFLTRTAVTLREEATPTH